MTLSLSLRALPIFALFAWTQGAGEKPLPDVRLLMQDVVAHERLALAAQRDYVVVEDDSLLDRSGECVTDPGEKSPRRYLTFGCTARAESHRRYEILWLDGVRASRLLYEHSTNDLSRVDASLSPDEVRREQERIDKDVAEARLHTGGQSAGTEPENRGWISMARVLELGDYSHASREMVKGRSVIVLDYKGNPPADTANPLEAALKQFIGTVTIDEEDRAVRRFEGYFVNEVRVRGSRGLFIHQYADIQLENVRMEDGLWFPGCVNARGQADYGDFKLKGGNFIEFHDYRKFRVSTRIEGTGENVPNDVPEVRPAPDNGAGPWCGDRVNVRSTNANNGVVK